MVQSGKTAWKMEVIPSSVGGKKGSLEKTDFNLSLLVSARTHEYDENKERTDLGDSE